MWFQGGFEVLGVGNLSRPLNFLASGEQDPDFLQFPDDLQGLNNRKIGQQFLRIFIAPECSLGLFEFAIFGPVFHAMVKEAAIPQVELIKIMRQADAAGIPRRAIVTQLFALTRTHS
jgi:hypothetical protein